MRRTKEQAAQTRQSILDAALQLFSQKGYQATRLQDVAEAAGLTRGAVYHHFANKADLYKTLIEEAALGGQRAIEDAVAAGGSFTEICERILFNSIRMLAEDRRFRQIWTLSLYKTGVAPDLQDIEDSRVQNARVVVEGIAGFMSVGIENGALRSDLEPHVTARAFLAFQNGLAWLWLANGEFFDIGAEAGALAETFMQGITAG